MSGTALFENLAAALSIVLMGICGARLLAALTRVLRGQEPADGLENDAPRRGAPVSALLGAALLALFTRMMIYLLAYVMNRMLGRDGGFFETLPGLWMHWDTDHYVGIAKEWYTDVGDARLRLVFFPLYPLLMRLVSPLTGGDVFAAGLLISLLCAMAASALLYDLSYMHFGEKTAKWTLAYFLASPMSLFLCCCYTEALFICLTLAAICLMRRGHPWLAAVFGMLSAFTRMPGVIVAGLLIIDLLGKIPKKQFDGRAVFACAGQVMIVFCGLFAYWLINWAVTGDPFTYLVYQRENWYQQPGSFWESMANTAHYAVISWGEDNWFFAWGYQLMVMLGVFVLMAVYIRRLPFDLAAYSFVYVAVVFSPTWLLSAPRYLFALAPLHLLRARRYKRNGAHALALGVSIALLTVMVFGYAIAIEVL